MELTPINKIYAKKKMLKILNDSNEQRFAKKKKIHL